MELREHFGCTHLPWAFYGPSIKLFRFATNLSLLLIIFYHLFLWLYRAGVVVLSFFNPKARLWVKGRVNVFAKMKKELKGAGGKRLWMHCASLGEFEQGKPVLKKILSQNPDIVPVISFFSPSGYEIAKRKDEFPYIYYLPLDSVFNAMRWLHIVRPSLVIWVKYEYWFFYLMAIQKRNIPLIMVSGVYRRSQPFFKWYGTLHRKMLKAFTHFFVQNHSSKRYLSTLVDANSITVSGDTRCDRVIEIAESFEPIDPISRFCGESRVMVCGSTWEADEAIWVHYANNHAAFKFIIAPHEIDPENIKFVKSQFTNSITYSEWEQENVGGRNCLVIDNVGLLSKLYHYADITYVGGGFGDNGLHNILEPAVYHKPVLFGPVTYKNFEAEEMLLAGGAKIVESAVDLEQTLNTLIDHPDELAAMGAAAGRYVYKNAGASAKIASYLSEQQWW